MPSRVLRDITDSERVELLSANAEVLMYRIFMKADDFGSFHANPKLIKSALFPLKDNVRETDISHWMDELLKAGLIAVYQVGTKQYLRVVNFGQRLRNMRNAFPHPDTGSQQLAAIRSNSPPETKRNDTETNKEINKEKFLWTEAKKSFLADEQWEYNFLSDKKISREYFKKLLKEFIKLIEDGEDLKSVRELRKHFTNWFNKKNKAGEFNISNANGLPANLPTLNK